MNEDQFWTLLDEAWKSDAKLSEYQTALERTIDNPEEREKFQSRFDDCEIPGAESFLAAVRKRLDDLSAEELLGFDRILEKSLYQIDREAVHQHTDGSDDGFLYCRGFIVAAGRSYYDAVDRDPTNAMFDLSCEGMCYISWHMYAEKFGDMPGSEVSRESFSNSAGWS